MICETEELLLEAGYKIEFVTANIACDDSSVALGYLYNGEELFLRFNGLELKSHDDNLIAKALTPLIIAQIKAHKTP